MWKKFVTTIICSLFFSVSFAGTEEVIIGSSDIQGSIESERLIADIDVTELLLSNGMTVALKPTKSLDNEILIQMTARGGWLAFPKDEQAAAKYAGTIALESGLKEVSRQELVNFLFKYSIEFSVRTREYFRSIEGSAPNNYASHLLATIHQYLTNPSFNQAGFDTVVANTRDASIHRKEDCELIFEEFFFGVNSSQSKALTAGKPLSKIDLKTAKELFEQSFSSPEEFDAIIVGNFDIDEIKPLVTRYLATIEKKAPSDIWRGESISLPFPEEVTRKEMTCGHLDESVIRLTFPATPPTDSAGFYELDLISQVIETRLRESLDRKFHSSFGVDVGYIFPLMPVFEPTWLSIKFRATQGDINKTLNSILVQLGKLQHSDLNVGELENTLKLTERMNLYWKKENRYWVAMLANYYRWRWELDSFEPALSSTADISIERVNELLSRIFPLDNYTVTIMH